jgi:hypothetical protein
MSEADAVLAERAHLGILLEGTQYVNLVLLKGALSRLSTSTSTPVPKV